MGNQTAAVKRPTGGRRAGATGRQMVGDYTGQRAGDAAQAVRRAGLRPGLERSFGCDPSLLGLVVSQEPPAGSALARNGMVTLYVAAPGNASVATDTAPAQPREPALAPEPTPAGLDRAGSDREPGEAAGTARRRRKPGLSGRAPEVFESAPAPLPPAQPGREPRAAGNAEQEPGELVEPEPADEVDGAELSQESSEEDGFDGLTPDEFVVHADDVFAGRTGSWRPTRRAPRARRAGRDLRERLTARPWLTGSAAFAIGLWVLLSGLGALAGQHPTPGHTAGSRPTARGPITRRGRAASTPIARAARPLGRRAEIAPLAAARRRALPTRLARTTARPARAARPRAPAAALSAAPVQQTPAAPSVPARPARTEQSSGGLFSP